MTSPTAQRRHQVQELFDVKADGWADKYQPGGPLEARRAAFLAAARTFAGPGQTALDLGCATGELARALASFGLQTVGCDISAEMLARAGRPDGAASWVRLAPGWTRLPFSGESFAVVTMASVLEYVDGPDVVLAECARVLVPGGTFLATVPDLSHPVRWLEWLPRQTARVIPLAVVAPVWPRLHRYLTYLRVSRQRHRRSWWVRAARQAGLEPAPLAPAPHQPLRLIAFRRPGPAGQPAADPAGRAGRGPERRG
jgi:SAM-dependent methyltransferase